jgi:hypothetical protein
LLLSSAFILSIEANDFQNLPPVTSTVSMLYDWKRSSTVPTRAKVAGAILFAFAAASSLGPAKHAAAPASIAAPHIKLPVNLLLITLASQSRLKIRRSNRPLIIGVFTLCSFVLCGRFGAGHAGGV